MQAIGLWAGLSWLQQSHKIRLKQHLYQMHTTYSTTKQEPVQISFPSISHKFLNGSNAVCLCVINWMTKILSFCHCT